MAQTAQTLPPDTQLFRDVFNASPIGIVVENLEGQPLFVNPALCSMLGFSEEELCTKHCVQFSPPEDAEKDWTLFQQLRAGSIDHYLLEKRYFRKDGSLFWGQLTVSLLKRRPSPLVVARVEDITEKKRAEEARFRHTAIVESSQDAIMSVTLDRIISTWNAGAERIYGYTEAEALGQPIDMIVPPELPDEENKILETLRAGGRIEQLETVRLTKAGKRINVSLSISPIKDASGEIVGCSGIARDITERKLAEDALTESAERLRLAQQAARMGTFELDIKSGVNTWNRELEALYGLPPGGFGGTQAHFVNLLHPNDRAGVMELIDDALKTGQPTNGEWRVVWPDGSVHWLAGRWQVFMDEVGKPSRMLGVNIDIADRKLAEEVLREYERAVEASGEMITVINREYRCLMANREYLNRRNATREQVVGHFAYELVDQRMFQDIFKPKLDECFRGNVIKFEMKYTYPELGERDLSISYYPVEGPDGIDRVACLLLDITDRKQAEHALREGEHRFRLATQAGKMYAFEWNVASDTVVRSGDVAGVLGPTGETELKRHQLRESIHPDDWGQFTTSMRETSPENPDVQMSYRWLRPDGSVAWLEKTAHAFFDEDGRMVRMIGMISDITERKRVEETLRESEEKFRGVFRDAGVGMVIVSPEGRFLAANGTFCDDLGYTEKELLEKSVESITLADDWPALSKRLSEALAGSDRLQRVEKRCLHKTGRIIWTESTASLIRSPDGNPQYFVVGVLDVTKRKQAEEALSTVNRRLIEAQEQERIRIGRELHDDVNQRLALLSIALEGLEHDPSAVPDRLRQLRQEIDEISNDVEALSHELHSSKLEYLGVVAGVRSWCKEFGDRQNIEIDFRSDVVTVVPFEIGVCLFRVLQEALHNIVKHSGVKRVDVRLTEPSNQIHLQVSDSGKGFDVESAMQGKGLGLTSMRERVRLVNGTIAIESRPMGGTTIEVRVPLESEQDSQRAS